MSLVGKVPYFWGGKSEAGWNDEWNTPKLVTAAGSSSTGTIRPYGLDCSGFTDWVYKTALGVSIQAGSWAQYTSSTPISEAELLPGDLGFLLNDSGTTDHVLIFAGYSEDGSRTWVHSEGGIGVHVNTPSYDSRLVLRRPSGVDFSQDVGSTAYGEPLYSLKVNVTHYCACTKCCGPNAQGITASGKKVAVGILIFMILVFLSGLGILLYPYVRGYLVDRKIERTADEFLSWVETGSVSPYPSGSQLDQDSPSDPLEPTEPDTYTDLWRDMVDYNHEIYASGQKGLDCTLAYEDPSFILADYGLESEVFAVISIPALELEMPVFLGATYRHMADGTAHLSQTSIPIGGKNTNCVIAGHRGWGGASYFRYVDKLQPGDEVIITNLWEEIHYRVVETQIIQPNEVEQILIKPGRELVTLLTCHPYASGGRQRYLVICERINYENDE